MYRQATGMNIFDLLASVGAIDAINDLARYAKTYVETPDFVANVSSGMGLKLAAGSLEDLAELQKAMNHQTPEQHLISFSNDLEGFKNIYTKYISGKTGKFENTADTIIRIAGIISCVATRASSETDFWSVFMELARQYNVRLGASRLSVQEKIDLMRCTAIAIQIGFITGNKITWLRKFREVYSDLKTSPEVAQAWVELGESTEVGIILSPAPELVKITDPETSSIVANAHRLFPEPEILNHERFLAIRNKNPELYNAAYRNNECIYYIVQYGLYNISNPLELETKIRDLIRDHKYSIVAALTRMGIFSKEMVFSILGEALHYGFCDLYTELQKTNDEADTLWKNHEKYDLSPYLQAYEKCKSEAESGETLQQMLDRHEKERVEMDAKINEEFNELNSKYMSETDPDVKQQLYQQLEELVSRQTIEAEGLTSRQAQEISTKQ